MRLIWIVVLMFIFTLNPLGVAYGETAQPIIYSGIGIAIDSSTGEVLYQKNSDEQAYPASLTKLMTAILLEEHTADGEWMTASKKATMQEASNYIFNLKVGEKMQKEDALKALLVISANDVAMMMAEHIGGDEAGFAAMMNEKAAALGMMHTHFVTPNGLHDPGHYTTAYDFALLAKEAMKYPAIMEAMGTEQTTVKTDQRQVLIKDRTLLFQNPLALGGKTGFTNEAHNTLLEYMKKDDKTVIVAVMKSTRQKEYPDVQSIGNYSLDRIEVQRMWQKGENVGETSFNGINVQGVLSDSFVLTKRKGDNPEFTYTPVFTSWPNDKTTIQAGEVIGSYQIKKNGNLLKQIPIVSVEKVERPAASMTSQKGSQPLSASFIWVTTGVLLLFVYGLFGFVKKRKKQKVMSSFTLDE